MENLRTAAEIVVALFVCFILYNQLRKYRIDDKKENLIKQNLDLWHDNIIQKIDSLGSEVRGALNASSTDRINIWQSLYSHGHQVDCKRDECKIETKSIIFPTKN
ncbi:MAG: hypothetical protein ABSD50_17375 [Smithella sp.]